MHVLHVIDQKPDGYPGGIEYHQLDLIRYFREKSIPVSLLFPEENSLCLRRYQGDLVEESMYGGMKLDDHRLRDPGMEDSFRRVLTDTGADIVHFQSIRTMPLSFIEIAKNAGVQVIVSFHEYYFWCINCIMLAPDFCWFERDEEKCHACLAGSNYPVPEGYVKTRRAYINQLFSKIDRVIMPSFYVRDVFLSLYQGLTEEQCAVIEFGVGKKLLADYGRTAKRAPNGCLKLAFLGNFLPYKGNRTFLELLDCYRDSRFIRFSIIGNIFDHSIIPSRHNLSLAGGYARDEVVKKIQKESPDVILLLSNWPETFSYTLSEAIAGGVPVIATDGGALRERVSKFSAGFLVPVENPLPRLVEIIEDLRENPGVLEFLNGAVSRARGRLRTVDDMAESIVSLYRSLLAGSDGETTG
ncbi:MAG: glycosyltransferase [Nitrospirota bacterium]